MPRLSLAHRVALCHNTAIRIFARRLSAVPDSGLPPEVERIIARHVHSVEQMEILLLLRKRREPWTADATARELRIDASSAQRRLEELTEAGFLTGADGAFLYAVTGELDRDVEQLQRCYTERRVAVITAIFSRPNDRLRSFSDAFRFKGGK
jgi:hypothetical protein